MAYLHCHGKLPNGKNCGWSQDDFWEIGKYTPFRRDLIDGMEKDLFKDKIYMDSSFFRCNPEIISYKDDQGIYCKGQDLTAWDLERRAKRIRNMLVRTYEEFKKNKDKLKCPKCGQQKWDID
jgi:hypothetical protein